MFGIKSGIPLSTSLLLLLCGTASVLAQADWDEKWKSFTYNFGAWEDKKELAAVKPEKGTCSLVLQAGLDVRFSIRLQRDACTMLTCVFPLTAQ
jgi:hypothetical protein